MRYYPAWFDYANWMLVIAGCLCGFGTKSRPTGRERGLLKLACCILLGLGFLTFNLTGLLLNARAPLLHAKGVLFDVRYTDGRNSSTSFSVPTPAGELDLKAGGDHREISNGENAEIIFQAQSNDVRAVSILDGLHAGWNLNENDGDMPMVLFSTLAVSLILYGIYDWFNDGRAQTPDDTESMPDGDVDSASILDLSTKGK